jgi:tRNA nucleotidyltransferase (CCA-adding enzyme)
LQAKVLRHVGPAFAEDPVRILRIARFAARFSDFTVAPETLALMRSMVAAGEVDHLVAERVWQELAKGLMEDKPSRMFEVCATAVRWPACCRKSTSCSACRSAPTITRKSIPAFIR